jgi:cation diffusion facilitator family transporter
VSSLAPPQPSTRLTVFQRLAIRIAPGCADPGNREARARIGLLEGWVSIVANTLMAAGKLLMAMLSGSMSLFADAVHTFADSLTSVVVIVGFKLSQKPADHNHPFGHDRIESIASLIIGVLLAVAAFELGRESVMRLIYPQASTAPTWIIIVVVGMALAKELMARFSFDLGKLIDSDALEADAWHHRSDVFATILVALALVATRIGWMWLDGVAGIGVALILCWAAWHTIRQSAQPLIGERASDEELNAVMRIANTVAGVLEVHDIIMQRYGQRMVISLDVVVSGDLSARQVHSICEKVEHRLMAELRAHATVHADPLVPRHDEQDRIYGLIHEAVMSLAGCDSFHDLRVEEDEGGQLNISFDVVTSEELSDARVGEYHEEIAGKIRGAYPQARIMMEFDPPFCLAPKL